MSGLSRLWRQYRPSKPSGWRRRHPPRLSWNRRSNSRVCRPRKRTGATRVVIDGIGALGLLGPYTGEHVAAEKRRSRCVVWAWGRKTCIRRVARRARVFERRRRALCMFTILRWNVTNEMARGFRESFDNEENEGKAISVVAFQVANSFPSSQALGKARL